MLIPTQLESQCRRPVHPTRSGAAAVEMAFCLIPLLTMFFAIFEYGRFMMDLNLMDNAARAGCRFAICNNTNTNLLLTTPGVTWSGCIQGWVSQNLTPRPELTNTNIYVTGWHNTGTAWVQTQMTAITYNGSTWSVANTPTSPTATYVAMSSLVAGDQITVQVTATYSFITPMPLLPLKSSVMLLSATTMLCEGAT